MASQTAGAVEFRLRPVEPALEKLGVIPWGLDGMAGGAGGLGMAAFALPSPKTGIKAVSPDVPRPMIGRPELLQRPDMTSGTVQRSTQRDMAVHAA